MMNKLLGCMTDTSSDVASSSSFYGLYACFLCLLITMSYTKCSLFFSVYHMYWVFSFLVHHMCLGYFLSLVIVMFNGFFLSVSMDITSTPVFLIILYLFVGDPAIATSQNTHSVYLLQSSKWLYFLVTRTIPRICLCEVIDPSVLVG